MIGLQKAFDMYYWCYKHIPNIRMECKSLGSAINVVRQIEEYNSNLQIWQIDEHDQHLLYDSKIARRSGMEIILPTQPITILNIKTMQDVCVLLNQLGKSLCL